MKDMNDVWTICGSETLRSLLDELRITYRGKFAFWCATEKDRDDLFGVLHQYGCKWGTREFGRSLMGGDDHWKEYKENTVYFVDNRFGVSYQDVNYAEKYFSLDTLYKFVSMADAFLDGMEELI